MNHPEVIIVGGGLGGLLHAAHFARQGRAVTLLEALDFVGGRFTHIDYQGFAVPTGAFHSLPGGRRGPIYQCLETLGLEVPLVEPDPSFLIVTPGETYPVDLCKLASGGSGAGRAVGLRHRAGLAPWLLKASLLWRIGIDTPVAAFVPPFCSAPHALAMLDHLTEFSLGVPAPEASVVELVASLRRQRFGREGFLTAGNRSLVEALRTCAETHGAELRLRTRVDRLLVEGGRVCGVATVEGEELRAPLVISGAGGVRTAALLGSHAPAALSALLQHRRSAAGAAHAVRCRRRLLDHSSVEIPTVLPHIAGIVPVSNLCPGLAPPGWSFALAYQGLESGRPVEEQVAEGHTELRDYLGADVEVFNTAVYAGTHPAAALSQSLGQHGRRRLPLHFRELPGLYLAGHDVAGYGTAAEAIGDSCQRLWGQVRLPAGQPGAGGHC